MRSECRYADEEVVVCVELVVWGSVVVLLCLLGSLSLSPSQTETSFFPSNSPSASPSLFLFSPSASPSFLLHLLSLLLLLPPRAVPLALGASSSMRGPSFVPVPSHGTPHCPFVRCSPFLHLPWIFSPGCPYPSMRDANAASQSLCPELRLRCLFPGRPHGFRVCSFFDPPCPSPASSPTDTLRACIRMTSS